MIQPQNIGWQLCQGGAITAPTVNDDSSLGFSQGSRWFDTTNNKEYVCLDATATAAVWKETTAQGTGVFGSEYIYDETESESSTTSETYQQKRRLTTPSLPAGDYHIEWSICVSSSKFSKELKIRVQVDDTTTLVEAWGYGFVTPRFMSISGHRKVTLSAATHNIDVDYACDKVAMTAYIKNVRISLWRVS